MEGIPKNTSKQQKEYIGQVRNVLIAQGGNAVTLGPASKDKELLLLKNIRTELGLRRLNLSYKEEIAARSGTCLPWFSVVDFLEEFLGRETTWWQVGSGDRCQKMPSCKLFSGHAT